MNFVVRQLFAQGNYLLMRFCGRQLSIRLVSARSREEDLGMDILAGQCSQQMRREGYVSVVTQIGFAAIGEVVRDGARPHLRSSFSRSLKEPGKELEHLTAVRTCSFREEHDRNAGLQSGRDLARHGIEPRSAPAFDKDSPSALREDAEERPREYFELRDEDTGQER